MSRIRRMHPVERPRERLLALGAAALSEQELLAVLLRTGCAGLGALELSGELLRGFPDGALARADPRDLALRRGMGPSRAAAVAAAAELGRRWAEPRSPEAALETPERVFGELSFLRGKRKEYFVAFYLDARNRLLHRETVSIGTLTASLVHPREVFAPALERRAAGVIVAHNHPSGDPRPSAEDREATRRLERAARILGIGLLDHVLVADDAYFSFREHGLLEEGA